MNVLFLTLLGFNSLQERTIYTDLLRVFVRNGHHVYAVSPAEKRQNIRTHMIEEENASILRLEIGDTQKTSTVKKGINTILVESRIKKAIKTYFSAVKFDLVLYTTPPITLVSAIEYVKNRDKAKTYLLLKDIFPQNAVDIGMMSTTGAKGLLYSWFRTKEKSLYSVSDHIGCMSPSNVQYVLNHNPEVQERNKKAKKEAGRGIIEVCPNSIEAVDKSVDEEIKERIREKYGIPKGKKVFVYGGNLGKPQGIPFIIDCLKRCQDIEDAFFLIVGDGTEYNVLKKFIDLEAPNNVKLMARLPKEDYDIMVGACDVGLIFLDHRFTIPNFPSRLLSYMSAKLPVLACTDRNSDVGKTIVEGGFGWWVESNDADQVHAVVQDILNTDLRKIGENGWMYLQTEYSTEKAFQIIMNGIQEEQNVGMI